MKIRSMILVAALGLLWCLPPRAAHSATPPQLVAGRFADDDLVPTKRDSAPVSLTASDGTGLELVQLEAQAVVDGPLAFTELHMTFQNPQDRLVSETTTDQNRGPLPRLEARVHRVAE